ncbi:hypothetical protein [Pseudomonas fluorescens]|uniref:hypothetical protein n=1 Tax=Pseudomonas fluorescens TaxID=294 RepID=UPI0016564A68|nr:hypothetical protein [Pseudomonas fluorescens]MBC8786545.1 hypothetical protein [Pseudomonas fluorescens]
MTDYTELQKAAEYAAQDTIKFADEEEEMRALQQFHEEVDPETVLALIAENDSALKHWQNESNNVQVLVAEVARLKAENEALRKHQPSAEVIWCACGDGHAASSYGAGFMDANGGVCANCEAAMGKGEQS